MAEQNHRSQPAMAGEFFREISSVNTAIAGDWVQPFGYKNSNDHRNPHPKAVALD
jgi:hypothetical protein